MDRSKQINNHEKSTLKQFDYHNIDFFHHINKNNKHRAIWPTVKNNQNTNQFKDKRD